MTRPNRVMLREMLARVRCYPPTGEIGFWLLEEVAQAERWAARAMQGDPPPPPGFLAPYLAKDGEDEMAVRRRTGRHAGRGLARRA